MRNIKLILQYDGTRYAGWQFQNNAKSIQEVLEAALKKITGEDINVTASGRTDSGVHARAQAANFKTASDMAVKNIRNALNSILPADIVIAHIEEVEPGFDSQRSAKYKIYRYTVVNSDFLDPFIKRFAVKFSYKLDLSAMRRAAKYLMGKKDFRSFKTVDKGDREKNTVRTIKKITIKKDGHLLYIDVAADGFLYNMIRNIAGTLMEVGRGKMAAGRVKEILAKKDRRFGGPTAPAKGLCLIEVGY